MPRVLILFAHPALQKSRVNQELIRRIPDRPDVTFVDLYEEYPDFMVDVPEQQALLEAHEVVVLMHPFYWYSVPPLLKQWIDLVLEHGWAYGSQGNALRGKALVNAITAGGGESAYQPEGYNRFTVRQFLTPIEQTARLCGMRYLPPWVVFGTHRLGPESIQRAAERFEAFVNWLAGGGAQDAGLDRFQVLDAAEDPSQWTGGAA